MKLTKSKLKEIIREEIQKLNEASNKDLYKKIVKKYKLKKGDDENKLINAIIRGWEEWTPLSKKQINYYVNYDADFLSDELSELKPYLK
jgi:hypothetical protein